MEDAVAALRLRLRADLRAAMLNKATDEVSVLRTLLAELDNSEAISVGDLHDRYLVKSFGDGSAEAPRKQLTHDDLQELLQREHKDRLEAAADLDAGKQPERARKLRDQAEIVRRYLSE